MPTFDPTYPQAQAPTGLADPNANPQGQPQVPGAAEYTGEAQESGDNPGGPGAGITINEDGSITIGAPEPVEMDPKAGFNANLASKIDPGKLATLANDVIEGVSADIVTRQGFIENYNKGLELLGLKIEEATTARTQKRNVSRIGHPLLLEACVRFQAQARAELLPAFGPCKVATIGGSTENQDELANQLESDMNYFLTQIDKGFYPDMDRGLFVLGFGGNIFKKVYHDPIKRIPMSRCIQIEDFIVSENASDLYDAQRKTHRLWMTTNEVKKMQHAGAYRKDISVGDGQFAPDPTKMMQGSITGIAFNGQRTQDQEHEIYETYLDLDPEECLGIREKGAPSGLPLPYIVTVERSTMEVYSVRRNWKEGDPQFQERRRFIHYGLIPSFTFLCLGYLHLLGNQTRALRAIWRIMIDAGMFSTFPGGIKAKGVRTDTNELAPGPGEFVEADIGPFDDIKSAFMPMPYKDLSPNLMQLSEIIGQDSQRLSGLPEMEVGEGRTHIPVGTMMSMIEQATQTMAAVHKRLHSSMQEELTLIKELFMEDPKALTRLARSPAREAYVAQEFSDINLVPASDPNIPSQTHRIQQATALVTLSQGPTTAMMYDQLAVQRRALRAIGINDWQTVVHAPPPPSQSPPPEVMAKMAELKLKGQELQFQQQDSQRKAASELASQQAEEQEQQASRQFDLFELDAKMRMEREKQNTQRLQFAHEAASKHIDRAHEAKLQQHAEAHETHRTVHVAHVQAEADKAVAEHAAREAEANAAEAKASKPKATSAKPVAKKGKD